MNKLALLSLAASAALVPGLAVAQSTVEPPVRWQDVPPAELRAPGNATRPVVRRMMAARPMAPMAHAPMMREGHHDKQAGAPGNNHRMDGRRSHRRNGYRDYRRVDRGHMVPQQWWGPGYQVGNWGMYGFPQPMHGRRWVRYYDDALLIDHGGMVHDGRYGMDWDRYGDSWGYDDRGVPFYEGEGDYHADGGDYEYGEGYDRDDGYAGHGYGYGNQGYGYGYGYGGMVVVTETTVTTAPTVTKTVYYDDVAPKRHHKKAKRHYKPKPKCDCPAVLGEKG